MPANDLPSALRCHADSACAAVRALTAASRVIDSEHLEFAYVLEADLARLRIPADEAPHRGDELWKHTCFEAFVRIGDGPAYWEFNFAPSRAWAMYRFAGRRAEMAQADAARAPQISVRRASGRLSLEARVHWPDVLKRAPPLPLLIGAAAVLEDDGGRLSYWALRHPPGKPDFHDLGNFVLELDP